MWEGTKITFFSLKAAPLIPFHLNSVHRETCDLHDRLMPFDQFVQNTVHLKGTERRSPLMDDVKLATVHWALGDPISLANIPPNISRRYQ